jgi:tetratricopeptide (TPR) repeat protein
MSFRFWDFIQDDSNRAIISWLGSAAAAVVAGAFAVFKFIRAKPKDKPPATTTVVTQAGSGFAAGRDNIITGPVSFGLNEQQYTDIFRRNVASPLQELHEQLEAFKVELKHQLESQHDAAQQAELQRQYDHVQAILGIAKKQIRSVQLIEAGKFDQAVAELDSAEIELNRIPLGSALALNQRGYIYKTFAQALSRKGDEARAKSCLNKAFDIFKQVENDRSASERDIADAIHGSGNIKHLRGEFRAAIADYDSAIRHNPDYSYAWYDRFLAYQELAQQGEVDQAAMRESLNQMKETGAFTPEQIESLEAILLQYER